MFLIGKEVENYLLKGILKYIPLTPMGPSLNPMFKIGEKVSPFFLHFVFISGNINHQNEATIWWLQNPDKMVNRYFLGDELLLIQLFCKIEMYTHKVSNCLASLTFSLLLDTRQKSPWDDDTDTLPSFYVALDLCTHK